MEELVVLLDETGREIGTMPKRQVHTAHTPLHRAFSCYVFGPSGDLLVTQRALDKSTFPGVWTNTVCGHPTPGEDDRAAITRRAAHELGLEITAPRLVLPRFRYRAEFDGVVENEICPVYLARTVGTPRARADEVNDYAWMSWGVWRHELEVNPLRYSAWSREQVAQLEETGAVADYLNAIE